MKTQKIFSSLVFALLFTSVFFYANNASATDYWRFVLGYEVGCAAPGSPAIGDDGTIYIGSLNGIFYAIKPNGTLKWAFEGTIFGYTAAIGEDGTIFVGDGSTLFAINPDGTEKWAAHADCLFLGAPAIAEDGTIYIGSNTSHLFAFWPEDGDLKWAFDIGYEGAVCNPVIGTNGTIYVGSTAFHPDPYGVFFAIDLNGTEKWRFAVNNYSDTSAAIGNDGTVYFVAPAPRSAGGGITLYAFSPSGTKKWIYNAPSGFLEEYAWSSPVIGEDGTIYFGSRDSICAVNPNGSYVDSWQLGDYDELLSTPAIGADGKIYVGSWDSYVYYFDPFDVFYEYAILATEGQVHSSPAITNNGVLWIGCMYEVWGARTTSLGPADSSWPLDRCNLKRTARLDGHFFARYLFARLRTYIIEQHFQRGISKSLISKLDSAMKSFEKGRIVAARNKLNAFINEVKAQRGKKIPRRKANYLISQVREIMELLPPPPRNHRDND